MAENGSETTGQISIQPELYKGVHSARYFVSSSLRNFSVISGGIVYPAAIQQASTVICTLLPDVMKLGDLFHRL